MAITKEVNRLRKQFIFLFVLLVGAVVLYGLKNSSTTTQIQALVDQIREDRHAACLLRVEQLTDYNSHVEMALMNILEASNVSTEQRDRLRVRLTVDLQFPLPVCPPDPSP